MYNSQYAWYMTTLKIPIFVSYMNPFLGVVILFDRLVQEDFLDADGTLIPNPAKLEENTTFFTDGVRAILNLLPHPLPVAFRHHLAIGSKEAFAIGHVGDAHFGILNGSCLWGESSDQGLHHILPVAPLVGPHLGCLHHPDDLQPGLQGWIWEALLSSLWRGRIHWKNNFRESSYIEIITDICSHRGQ